MEIEDISQNQNEQQISTQKEDLQEQQEQYQQKQNENQENIEEMLKKSKIKEKNLMTKLFYKNRDINNIKQQIQILLQDINQILQNNQIKDDIVSDVCLNNEFLALMKEQNEKFKQFEDLNEKIFIKKLQKIDYFNQKKDKAQQEAVYVRAEQIQKQNEQLGILISREHLDSYYLEGEQYKQVGEGLKEEIKQIIRETNQLENEIKNDTETLTDLTKKLQIQKNKNSLLKKEIKQQK